MSAALGAESRKQREPDGVNEALVMYIYGARAMMIDS